MLQLAPHGASTSAKVTRHQESQHCKAKSAGMGPEPPSCPDARSKVCANKTMCRPCPRQGIHLPALHWLKQPMVVSIPQGGPRVPRLPRPVPQAPPHSAGQGPRGPKQMSLQAPRRHPTFSMQPSESGQQPTGPCMQRHSRISTAPTTHGQLACHTSLQAARQAPQQEGA